MVEAAAISTIREPLRKGYERVWSRLETDLLSVDGEIQRGTLIKFDHLLPDRITVLIGVIRSAFQSAPRVSRAARFGCSVHQWCSQKGGIVEKRTLNTKHTKLPPGEAKTSAVCAFFFSFCPYPSKSLCTPQMCTAKYIRTCSPERKEAEVEKLNRQCMLKGSVFNPLF